MVITCSPVSVSSCAGLLSTHFFHCVITASRIAGSTVYSQGRLYPEKCCHCHEGHMFWVMFQKSIKVRSGSYEMSDCCFSSRAEITLSKNCITLRSVISIISFLGRPLKGELRPFIKFLCSASGMKFSGIKQF